MRAQIDNQSDFSVADLIRRKQGRRESKVEWSDRMLDTSYPREAGHFTLGSTRPETHSASKLKDEFFSLLMDDSSDQKQIEGLEDAQFGGTKNQNSPLNKQEVNKKSFEVCEYEVSSQDFGKLRVEVQVASNQIFMLVHVDQPLPVQSTEILQRLVASRLGHQFGKNFEVQIKCQN